MDSTTARSRSASPGRVRSTDCSMLVLPGIVGKAFLGQDSSHPAVRGGVAPGRCARPRARRRRDHDAEGSTMDAEWVGIGAVRDAVDGAVMLTMPGLGWRAAARVARRLRSAATGIMAARSIADAAQRRGDRRTGSRIARNRFLTARGSSSRTVRPRRASDRGRASRSARPSPSASTWPRGRRTEPWWPTARPARSAAPVAVASRTGEISTGLLRGVGERLHERRVVGHAAVDAQRRDRDAAVGFGRVDEVGAAVRDALRAPRARSRRGRCRASGRTSAPRAP